MPRRSIAPLNLRSARIVLAKSEDIRPLGFIGDYVNAFTGWIEPSRSETVLARVNPSKRGNASGDLVLATEWRPSSGKLDPKWTYAATLVTTIPGRGETVIGSLSVDPFEELDPVCAIALGALLTTRDSSIGILDTMALTASIFSVATGELPDPLRKSASALGVAGDASFAIRAVSARYDDGDLDQIVVEYALNKSAGALASTPTERAVLAGKDATELAEFLMFQGATNGDTVVDTCMY